MTILFDTNNIRCTQFTYQNIHQVHDTGIST